ncbi:MlaD family protein [Hoyosella altamirensis]|uniref:Phospholipid/cholesterol/gamma-HCH transport system substrate-binding protein n=1 Tax=Hoyosella altamirensis TaxID=616997 RepID=A0A839RNP8_9ACTN|nr:MCE family protein [Hoyosella altamirensis]MBB3037686.1 phospholipid/cholesterol/gamma-HCH transport system substrate-binding protein [Hoyosella altamirensis]
MRRSTKVQLALFIALALFIIPAGTRYALGAQFLSLSTIGLGERPVSGTAYFDNGRGLGPGTVVTYQGVVVGEIREIRPVPPSETRSVDTDQGPVEMPIQVDFQLDPGVQVSNSVTPVSTTLNVAGLVNLELRPGEDAQPGVYLEDGAVLVADPALQRADFREVLVALNDVIETVDVDSVSALLTTLGDTFTGRGEDIGDIIDNVGLLADVFDKHSETVEWLGLEGPATMALIADASDALPSSFTTFRTWTRQLVESTPDLESLIDTGPGGMRRISDILVSNQDNAESMMAGLADIAPILGNRDAALRALVDDFPRGLDAAAGISRGSIADFHLVVTQGPVCYYDTPRRVVGDQSPREPNRGVFCPPGNGLAQRGAVTAPRPDGLGLVKYTSPGIQTGPPIVSDPLILAPATRAALGAADAAARDAGLPGAGGAR